MQEVFESLQAKFSSPMAIQHGFIISAGLSIFVHAAFLVAALYFLAQSPLRYEASCIDAWIQRHATWIIWLPAMLLLGLFFLGQPAPKDDLLAISSIAIGGFSHGDFAFSSWGALPISPWFGYEWLLESTSRYLGQDAAMRAAQGISVIFTAVSITLAVRFGMRGRSDLTMQALVLIGLAMASLAMGRAISGRVESLFFAWSIAAFWMPAPIWLTMGIAMSPMYWLAWIYAPAALLLRGPIHQRFVYAAIYGLVAVSTWFVVTDGEYLRMFELTSKWLGDRQAIVGENVTMLTGLAFSPSALLLIIVATVLLVARKGVRQEWPIALVAAWFSLPDMLRYVPVIATIAAVWIMGTLTRERVRVDANTILLIFLIPLAMMLARSVPGGDMDSLPQFKVPTGSIVFGGLNEGLYATIHHNRGIHPTPAFELGATDPEIQKAAKQLSARGEFDCSILRFYPIDYVLENRLRTVPACLSLDQVQGVWRLWKTNVHSNKGNAS